MLLADRYSSREMTSSCEESGDEELSVLPRHTKVVVTGNNRTKSVLIGLHGVVKKAVGLGGWHWLVLKNGIEVKLQRNALSVVEAPTGHEEDEIENDSESRFWGTADLAPEELRKPFKPKVRNHKPTCTTSKACIRNTSSDLHSCSRSSSQTIPKVNFSKLETEALRRYWKHFNLVEINANPSKEQLVDIVERHFISQQLDELQVIAGFIQAAKRLKSAHIARKIQD